MPVHGIRLDLEFAAILAGGVILSNYITGELVSNALFTALISVLFFLIGLNLDLDKLRKCGHHKKAITVGLSVVYILIPITGLGLSTLFSQGLSDALIAVSFSTAALGTPVVFSNIARGEGELALITSGISLMLGIVAIPILFMVSGITIPWQDLAARNILFLGIPLSIGIGSQHFENFLFDDFRHHFSKLGLWLIVTVMAVQLRLAFGSLTAVVSSIVPALIALAALSVVSVLAGYFIPLKLGMMEKEARTLSMVSGSKGIAVALFIASQMSGAAVAFVTMYYFIRQGVTGLTAQYFREGSLRSLAEKRVPKSLLRR